MSGSCPHCLAELELPGSGSFQCPQCRRRFDVVFCPPGTAPPPGFYPAGWTPASTAGVGGGGSPAADPAALSPGWYSVDTLVAPEPVTSPDDPHCALHPANRGSTACERCGDFICTVCRTPTEGRIYCPRCFELLAERGALGWAQNEFQAANTAFALAWVSIPTIALGCAGLFPAAMAVLTGLDALKKIEARPELPGRSRALFAVITGSAVLLLTIGGGGWLVWYRFFR